MELLADPGSLAILAAVGFIAGFIDAVVGGGGLLSIPALLTLGLPPHMTLGTNKLASSFSSCMSAWTYYRKHFFKPAFWYNAGIACFLGAVAGTFIVSVVDNSVLDKLLPLIIIIIALYTLLNPKAMGCDKCKPPKVAPASKTQWLHGLPLGFYDGFAGPGIGAFWTVSSTRLYQLPVLHSIGLARAMTFVSNVTSLTIFLALGLVNIQLGLAMGVCMMFGAFIGARFAIKFGLPFIRPLFITIVILIAANLAWRAWF
ncbi:sulfite exporter TauE/SafE family protein [Shewanella corallii]|uniref:Probable membrane transporter protein n=1 Tax=Shewanella corallii TaxID=560080 RepID=A0ABT0NBI3_9GAMM|nr:TSUP family transporter [Shewanella corallii]MCL2915801.1 sulfite exporter TauE/SafE family protein [Shewanella corallii]